MESQGLATNHLASAWSRQMVSAQAPRIALVADRAPCPSGGLLQPAAGGSFASRLTAVLPLGLAARSALAANGTAAAPREHANRARPPQRTFDERRLHAMPRPGWLRCA